MDCFGDIAGEVFGGYGFALFVFPLVDGNAGSTN